MTVASSELIKKLSILAGFDACGIARPVALEEDAIYLKKWLSEGNHGNMSYLERNFEKRTDPGMLVPGCASVVVLLHNYYSSELPPGNAPRIARYAWSEKDYHQIIKEKSARLENLLLREYGIEIVSNLQHSFVDSAPILERRWAQRAGLGWIGKHTQLIAPGFGSYVFISVLLLQIPTDKYDEPIQERCGNCSRCIQSCPTQALSPYHLTARKCISYLTIENKEPIPEEFHSQLSGNLIGCDICGDVCPWNRKWAHPHKHAELNTSKFIMEAGFQDWSILDKSGYNKIFKDSALKRAGFEKISQNLQFIYHPE